MEKLHLLLYSSLNSSILSVTRTLSVQRVQRRRGLFPDADVRVSPRSLDQPAAPLPHQSAEDQWWPGECRCSQSHCVHQISLSGIMSFFNRVCVCVCVLSSKPMPPVTTRCCARSCSSTWSLSWEPCWGSFSCASGSCSTSLRRWNRASKRPRNRAVSPSSSYPPSNWFTIVIESNPKRRAWWRPWNDVTQLEATRRTSWW